MRKPACVILILFCACAEERFGSEQREKVHADVTTFLHQYCEDVRKEGLKAEFRYLDSSAEFSWLPPGYKKILGFKEVSEALIQNEKKFALVDNKYESLNVHVITERLASYKALLKSYCRDTSGKESSVRLEEHGIVVRRASGWKLLSGHTLVRD